jgi:tetratricopeptide (TPR) repeat protein
MNDALLWNEIGNIYLKMDLYDEAIAVYLKSIELNPDSGWTYSNLAFSYYRKGEYGRAVSLYRISIPLLDNPKYLAITWNRLGDAFRALKDVDNAIIAYKKADDLEISPSLSSVLANKQRTTTDKLPPQFTPVPPAKVLSGLEKNNVDGNRTSPMENQGANRRNLTNTSPAKESQYAPAARPVDNNRRPDPKQNTSDHLHSQIKPLDPKQIAASNEMTGRAVDGASTVTTYELKKSNLLVIPAPKTDQDNIKEDKPVNEVEVDTQPINLPMVGKLSAQQAEAESNKPPVIPKKEKDTSTNNTLKVDSNINLEETLAKVHIYENITQANPNNDRAWDTLGKLYKSLGRYEDAVAAYKQAIDKAPGREVYYYYLGLLYSVTKQDEEAAWAFENVLKLNPDYVLAHSALAGIYRRLGFESKANDHISIALPRMDNESAYNLACFYAICGEAYKAMDYLQLALKNKDTTIEWIRSDPDLELLHNDQRYQSLIQELDNSTPQQSNENYYSSDLDGKNNKLLPLLNNSLSR